MKKNILIILFSTIFSIYFINTAMLVYKFINSDRYSLEILKKKMGKNYDKRYIFQVYKDYKKDGKEILPPIYASTYLKYNKTKKNILFPISIISNKDTVFCNETGTWLEIKTDRFGFNNIDKIWDKKNIDVAFIGDSYISGECVKRSNNMSSKFSKKTSWSSINLGLSGNSPLQNIAAIKEYALKLNNLKNIFFFFTEANDLEDISDYKNTILINYTDRLFNQNLINKQKIIDTELKKIINLMENEDADYNFYLEQIKKILLLDEIRKVIKYSLISIEKESNLNIIFSLIKQANDISIKNNINFHFVYLPHDKRLVNKNYKKRRNILKRDIEIFLLEQKIKFIDLTIPYENDKNPLRFSIFNQAGLGHFNSQGYDFFAEELKSYILKNK